MPRVNIRRATGGFPALGRHGLGALAGRWAACPVRGGRGGYNSPAMYQLTREVRFAIEAQPPEARVCNGHAGCPPLTGLGYFLALEVTLSGPLDGRSSYLVNIKAIDEQVRRRGLPVIEEAVRSGRLGGGLLQRLFAVLGPAWGPVRVEGLRLRLSPYLSLATIGREYPMIRLSQRFEFSAAHRLHNPALSEEENGRLFGKCANPHGHGHNYELEVELRGEPDSAGVLMGVVELERIVMETVIERLDHKNLNVEVAEFGERIPSVENIAAVIWGLLRPRFEGQRASLAAVRVWETPRTWCEYSEE